MVVTGAAIPGTLFKVCRAGPGRTFGTLKSHGAAGGLVRSRDALALAAVLVIAAAAVVLLRQA